MKVLILIFLCSIFSMCSKETPIKEEGNTYTVNKLDPNITYEEAFVSNGGCCGLNISEARVCPKPSEGQVAIINLNNYRLLLSKCNGTWYPNGTWYDPEGNEVVMAESEGIEKCDTYTYTFTNNEGIECSYTITFNVGTKIRRRCRYTALNCL